MITLALLALVASVLVWAAPSSQAQVNEAPIADAGQDRTVAPGGPATTLTAAGSIDLDDSTTTDNTDCSGCSYFWQIQTGPYDWLALATPRAQTTTLSLPSATFVNTVSDNDPQKYEIVVQLTVTDDKGATDTDTVTIRLNRPPTADIALYAGLKDDTVIDPEATIKERYSLAGVIDGPGENGNRDYEWDVYDNAYVQLDGSGSSDPDNLSGRPTSYSWERISITPSGTGDYNPATSNNLGLTLEIGAVAQSVDIGGTATSFAILPDITNPRDTVTVFYRLTVCDASNADGTPVAVSACAATSQDSAIIRIVVHDSSVAPKVDIKAALTEFSKTQLKAAPQSTVGQITGVDNQFIVDAGSTVVLTAEVKDADQPASQTAHSGHRYRWTGATQLQDVATTTTTDERRSATVRIPANAEDGDTIDVSVTVVDNSRNAVEVPIQLLVGKNTPPTASGVPANLGTLNIPDAIPAAQGGGRALIHVHSITDGIQPLKPGQTIPMAIETLRGVANDADGDALITAWTLREGPNHAALNTAVESWVTAIRAISPTATVAEIETAREAANAATPAALGGTTPVWQVVAGALQDMQEPVEPLVELEGAFTDTISFEVPNLQNTKSKGSILLFSVIDSKGVASAQLIYLHIRGDDDAPDADAGDNQQVDPEAFVRLNGSASSDPDVGDELDYRWTYVGARMDPAPDDRSPLSDAEISALEGWILREAKAGETPDFTNSDRSKSYVYIVNTRGLLLAGETGNTPNPSTSAYPWFDAPNLTGFNNIQLTFSLRVFDSADGPDEGEDLNGDGTIGDSTATVDNVNEIAINCDVNGDSTLAADVDGVDESAQSCPEYDDDTTTVTVVNRYFSGDVTGPNYCAGRSLGGPQTYPFDSDKDGVADTCALNTTRRATVARQNALETLANLNPVEFRRYVLNVCDGNVIQNFRFINWGDSPDGLENDVCETERVSPPPAAADPATADVYFSGTITGSDFCTNHSLGGARTYAHDSDGDGVADQCSLSTTRREAIARQLGLNRFIRHMSAAQATQLAEQTRLLELEAKADTANGGVGITAGSEEEEELQALRVKYATDAATATSPTETETIQASIETLQGIRDLANRYANALATECRALGSQDFGDSATALARDECNPNPATGRPLG